MKQWWENTRRYFRASDMALLAAVIACSVISAIMLYSVAMNGLDDRCTLSTFRTQIVASVLGLAAASVLSVMDYRQYARMWWLYAPIAIGLTLLTFTPLGYKRSGADDTSWISIGNFFMQPSEILKLAFVLSFAYHLSRDEPNMNKLSHMLLLCLHAAVPLGIVALQGDYGTAIVFAVIFLAELLSSKIALRYIIAGAIAIPAAGIFAWTSLLQSTHKERILILLNPGTNPALEYQQDQSLAAMAAGGVFGKGLAAEEYVFVPEMYNDFIYSYVGQAWGILGAILVLALLVFICLRVLASSMKARSRQGKFICTGVFGMIFAHCFLNIGMVLKVMPVIGIPLPFLSAGGTAVVCMYTALGLVNSTRCHDRRDPQLFYDT